MKNTTKTPQHFILVDSTGATVTTDKVGRHASVAAFARMMDRMATAAGVDRLRCTDSTGRTFEGGFALVGPFQKL